MKDYRHLVSSQALATTAIHSVGIPISEVRDGITRPCRCIPPSNDYLQVRRSDDIVDVESMIACKCLHTVHAPRTCVQCNLGIPNDVNP